MPMFRGSEPVNVAVKRVQMDGMVNTAAIIASPCLDMTFLSDSKIPIHAVRMGVPADCGDEMLPI